MQDNPLKGLPAPTDGTWWDTFVALTPWAFMAVSAIFAAWVKIREKRVDADAQNDASRLALEVEQLQAEFKQRKEFTDTILQEGDRLRERLSEAYKQIVERDKINAELQATIASMDSRIKTLESQIP